MSSVRVPIVRGMSRLDIECIAVQFIRQHAPESTLGHRPTPVLRIFDRVLPALGFWPDVDVLTVGLEGVTDPAKKTVTVDHNIYAGVEADDGRARFTTMHEVGHAILHAKQVADTALRFVNSSVMLARRSDIRKWEDPEWQSDVFAGATLMPAPALFRLERMHGALTVDLLRRTFLVSWQAAEIRISVLADHRDKLVAACRGGAT